MDFENTSEMVFTSVSLPSQFSKIDLPAITPKQTGAIDYPSDRKKTCKICRHPQREEIEALFFNGEGLSSNSRFISSEYGIYVSADTIKNHLLNHSLTEVAVKMGILIREATDPDSDLLTVRGIQRILLMQTLKKIATEEIEVRNLNDALRVLALQESIDRTDKQFELAQSMEGHSNDTIEGAMRQLGYIMNALRDTVPEQYLEQAVKRAWSLGLDTEIASLAEVPLYQLPPHPEGEVNMNQMVEDIKTLGRKRTREELEADGFFDDVPPGE